MGTIIGVPHPRLDPTQRYGLRATLFAVAFVLVFVPFGLLLTQVVTEGPLTELDTSLANTLHAQVKGRPGLVTFWKVISFLGSPPWFYAIVGSGAAYWLWRGRRRLTIYLGVTTLLGGAVDTAVKVLVNRPRPDLEDPVAHAIGKSFPSGHAMTSTICYGALLLAFFPVMPRRARLPAAIAAGTLVVLIALSRLALGVHYVTDVVGGIVLGLAWLAASVAAFRAWRLERGWRAAPVEEGLEPEAAADLTGA